MRVRVPLGALDDVRPKPGDLLIMQAGFTRHLVCIVLHPDDGIREATCYCYDGSKIVTWYVPYDRSRFLAWSIHDVISV